MQKSGQGKGAVTFISHLLHMEDLFFLVCSSTEYSDRGDSIVSVSIYLYITPSQVSDTPSSTFIPAP